MGRSESANTRGLVVVHTGPGKGKTTAALGMALRAVGHGMRVLVVEFLKGKLPSGEREAAKRLAPELTIVSAGGGFVPPDAAHWPARVRTTVAQAWHDAQKAVLGGQYDMVVLDELNCLVEYGAVSVGEVLRLIADKPPRVHLVITGRNAHRKLIAAADVVTHMRSTKHPFAEGAPAQPGIEF